MIVALDDKVGELRLVGFMDVAAVLPGNRFADRAGLVSSVVHDLRSAVHCLAVLALCRMDHNAQADHAGDRLLLLLGDLTGDLGWV